MVKDALTEAIRSCNTIHKVRSHMHCLSSIGSGNARAEAVALLTADSVP
jgi:hypothetical protein